MLWVLSSIQRLLCVLRHTPYMLWVLSPIQSYSQSYATRAMGSQFHIMRAVFSQSHATCAVSSQSHRTRVTCSLSHTICAVGSQSHTTCAVGSQPHITRAVCSQSHTTCNVSSQSYITRAECSQSHTPRAVGSQSRTPRAVGSQSDKQVSAYSPTALWWKVLCKLFIITTVYYWKYYNISGGQCSAALNKDNIMHFFITYIYDHYLLPFFTANCKCIVLVSFDKVRASLISYISEIKQYTFC